MNHDEGLLRLALLLQEQCNEGATAWQQALADHGQTLADTQTANQRRYANAQKANQQDFAQALALHQHQYAQARETNRRIQAAALASLLQEPPQVENDQDGEPMDEMRQMQHRIAKEQAIKLQHKQANEQALAKCKLANDDALLELKQAKQRAWLEFQQASEAVLTEFNNAEDQVAAEMARQAQERRALVRSVMDRLFQDHSAPLPQAAATDQKQGSNPEVNMAVKETECAQ